MLRAPSLAGKATERKAWYKASMLWSASAKTKNPEAAIAWINWFANNPEAADIDLAERGIPPNAEVLAAVKPKLSPAQQVVAKFISDIKTEVGHYPHRPTPWRRHDRRTSCSVTGPMSSSGGRAQLRARRSSWTS